MRILFSTIFSVLFLTSNAQNTFVLNGRSKDYKITVENKTCHETTCEGKSVVTITNAKTAAKVLSTTIESLSFSFNENKEILLDSNNNFIYFIDLNFDGKDDIVLSKNNNPYNLIEVTEVFLFSNGLFKIDRSLTDKFKSYRLINFKTNKVAKTISMYRTLENSRNPLMRFYCVYNWSNGQAALIQENEDSYNSDNEVEVKYKYYKKGSPAPIMQKQKKFNSLEDYLKTMQ
jgi:hypothetical protein